MDAEQIRSAFIKMNLNRALAEPNTSLASRIAKEFRKYFGWHAALVPDADRRIIAEQLSRLEQKLSGNRRPRPTHSLDILLF